ncbi:hypothetical protein JG486_03075 [Bacillus mycoides]|nr:hypothetical protein JG486_03075 [Bacillus mycoides]
MNFFFDSVNAWKKKRRRRSKGGGYAKVEAHISGHYFPIICRYWSFLIRYTDRELGMIYSLHLYIHHFTIVNAKI